MTIVGNGKILPPAEQVIEQAPAIEKAPGDPAVFILLANPTWAPWLPDTSYQKVPIGVTGQVLTVQADGSVNWQNSASGFANPMTSAGDLIEGGTGGTPTRFPIGTNGQVLTVSGGTLAWVANSAVGFANPMTTAGDLIDGGTAGAAQRLAIGASGQVLTVVSGAPAWANNPAGFSNPMTTAGDLIDGGTGGAPQRLAIGANNQVLTVVGGAPAWANSASGFANPMTSAGDMITGGLVGAAQRLPIGATGQVLTVVAGAPAWASGQTAASAVVFPSGDTTGVTDQANITSAYPANGGEVILAAGHFYVKPPSGLNCLAPPAQTTGGATGGNPVCIRGLGPSTYIQPIGAGVTGIYYHRTTSYSGSQITTFDPPLGYIENLVLDGQLTTGAAVGLDTGDGWGCRVQGVRVQNFTGTGAVGFNQVNRVFWTEKNYYQVDIFNCDTAVAIDCTITTAPSHEYNVWQFYMFQNTNQNGVVIRGGSNVTHGFLSIGGNMPFTSSSSGTPTNNVAMLTITGNDGAGDNSHILSCEIFTKVEGNTAIGSGTTLPYGVYMPNSANFIRKCHGMLTHTLTDSVINSAEFSFQGQVGDDSNLSQLFTGAPGSNQTSLTQPAIPASGTLQQNYATNAMVYVTAAAGGSCQVVVGGGNSVTVAASGTLPFFVNAGSWITLTYTSAPTWVWATASTVSY